MKNITDNAIKIVKESGKILSNYFYKNIKNSCIQPMITYGDMKI